MHCARCTTSCERMTDSNGFDYHRTGGKRFLESNHTSAVLGLLFVDHGFWSKEKLESMGLPGTVSYAALRNSGSPATQAEVGSRLVLTASHG